MGKVIAAATAFLLRRGSYESTTHYRHSLALYRPGGTWLLEPTVWRHRRELGHVTRRNDRPR